MPSTLLAVDRAQTMIRTAWSLKPLNMTPFGFSARQNFQLHGTGFNGEVLDPATGHYPLGNGYRSYDPALRRFNSPDWISPFGRGGLNGYAYCEGDPLNWRDPTGRSRFTIGGRRYMFFGRKRRISLVSNKAGIDDLSTIDFSLFDDGVRRLSTQSSRIGSTSGGLMPRSLDAPLELRKTVSYPIGVSGALGRLVRNYLLTPRDIEPLPPEEGAPWRGGPRPAELVNRRQAPVRSATRPPEPRRLPRRVWMAATGLASGYEEGAELQLSLPARQLRIRQG